MEENKLNIIYKGIVTIISLLIVVLFGFLLSRNGKPYNDILFTIHKIAALFMIIYSFLYIKKNFPIINNNKLVLIILGVIIASILILFLSGALLSIGKLDYLLLQRLHFFVSVLISVMIVWFVILFLKAI